MEISVSQFKAKCLGIIEKVEREKLSVVIKRYGKPAAQLVPAGTVFVDADWFGRGRSTTKVKGDILQTGEEWDASS